MSTRLAIPYISLFWHQQTHTVLLSVINKIHNEIKFFYRKNRFLFPTLMGLLFNALIEPHFKYTCSAWYPNLTKKLKSKIQTSQNKCIRFCLQLDKMTHTSHKEFEISAGQMTLCLTLVQPYGAKAVTCLSEQII